MVSTLEWVLVGIVAYAVVVMLLRARGVLPEYVRGTGPIVTLHTLRGKRILDQLARPKRAWRAWGNLGIGIGLVVMAGTLLMTLFGAYQALTDPQPTALTEPRNALVIPGVNDFLPLSAAPDIAVGLTIALIVHEGGHGLFCRVADIDIESMGLVFLSFIPMGAFVAPDEESVARAERGDQARMFAAGVTNNFAIGFLALILLFGPVAGAFGVVAGVPVGDTLPGSPADRAGLDSGDVITAVDGQPVANTSAFADRIEAADPTVELTLEDGETLTLERQVFVTQAAVDAPFDVGTRITAVNGSTVSTSAEFRDAIADRSVARISRANASDLTIGIGAYTRVTENGSFAAAGAPAGEVVVVTRAGDQRIVDASDLQRALADRSPGEELSIQAYVDGSLENYSVELARGDGPDDAHLGVLIVSGTSGFEVNDLGLDAYPAGTFLNGIGGNGGADAGFAGFGFLRQALVALALPFTGAIGFLNYGFPGFTGIATNFYTVQGPLAALGTGGAFTVANLLFWTAWVNLIVGQFNLFPAYPLDGGHIMRTITEAIVSRTPIENRRRVTTAVTVGMSIVVLGSMAMLFIGPQLLA